MLRDHECAGGEACALGDRRSIDAFIATHGIVADATDRVLWVSAGPHLTGKFVRVDLRTSFASAREPGTAADPDTMPEDPLGPAAAGSVQPSGAP
jgi:hypothetical protein